MKMLKKTMIVLCVAALLAACALPVYATPISRSFTGFHAKEYTTNGSSTYANGVATLTFPKIGAGCYTYLSGSATDVHFQFRIDTDADPEFDWLGLNITTDGEAFLGEGTGLSTLIWRTSDSINTRVVQDKDGMKWDNVADKEIMTGELYTGENDQLTEPYEDYRWGDGQWIDFQMKRGSNGAWSVTVDGRSIVRTPYSGFDKEMDQIFQNASKLTLSVFLANATGVVQIKGVDGSTPTSKTTAKKTTTKAGGKTTTTAKAGGKTTTTVAGETVTTAAGDEPTSDPESGLDAPTDVSEVGEETDVETDADAEESDGGLADLWWLWAILGVVVVGGIVVIIIALKPQKN